MSFKFFCVYCAARYSADAAKIGAKFRCKVCGKMIEVPGEGVAADAKIYVPPGLQTVPVAVPVPGPAETVPVAVPVVLEGSQGQQKAFGWLSAIGAGICAFVQGMGGG